MDLSYQISGNNILFVENCRETLDTTSLFFCFAGTFPWEFCCSVNKLTHSVYAAQ